MLVIRNMPEIYAKFKAYWIEQDESIRKQMTTQKESGEIESIEQSTKIWSRLNKDKFTPLTLAAELNRIKMLSWLLEERKRIQWSFGDVSCTLHPLNQLDPDFQDEVSQD